MDNNSDEITNSIVEIDPPKHLAQAVFSRIAREKARRISRKILWLRIGFIVSGILSIAALGVFGKIILTSEFSILLSLIFSDLKTVLIVWQDYVISLLETFPVISVVATLSPFFVFLLLIKQYAKLESDQQIKTIRLSFRT
ncbi:MAG: hypothetical protein HGA36_01415 [Candidatus Moranbacteria bacterium]|nr:hypothetical protein [Candidatus Moranbacteria bacterium]